MRKIIMCILAIGICSQSIGQTKLIAASEDTSKGTKRQIVILQLEKAQYDTCIYVMRKSYAEMNIGLAALDLMTSHGRLFNLVDDSTSNKQVEKSDKKQSKKKK